MDITLMKEHEYDAQLFGFTLENFMAAIKLLVKDEVTNFAQAMTGAIIKKYSSDDPEIEEVKKLTKLVVDAYIDASVEPLKNLEVQLRDVIHIPPHVLLPQDSPQRNQYSLQEEKEIDTQWIELLQRLKQTKCFDMELRQELKMLKAAIPLLNQRVEECEHLVREAQETEQCCVDMEASCADIINYHLNNLNINNS